MAAAANTTTAGVVAGPLLLGVEAVVATPLPVVLVMVVFETVVTTGAVSGAGAEGAGAGAGEMPSTCREGRGQQLSLPHRMGLLVVGWAGDWLAATDLVGDCDHVALQLGQSRDHALKVGAGKQPSGQRKLTAPEGRLRRLRRLQSRAPSGPEQQQPPAGCRTCSCWTTPLFTLGSIASISEVAWLTNDITLVAVPCKWIGTGRAGWAEGET